MRPGLHYTLATMAAGPGSTLETLPPMNASIPSSAEPDLLHVEADIPPKQRAEFWLAMSEIAAGRRPRLEALEQDVERVRARALAALALIERAIDAHLGSGQARSLVRFLAGLYNGVDYPFDLAQLRGLDPALASACLDYPNYDRLGRMEVHQHLRGGEAQLHRWLVESAIRPVGAST